MRQPRLGLAGFKQPRGHSFSNLLRTGRQRDKDWRENAFLHFHREFKYRRWQASLCKICKTYPEIPGFGKRKNGNLSRVCRIPQNDAML